MNKKEIKEDLNPRDKKVKRVKTHHLRSSGPVTPILVDCFSVEEEESSKLSPEDCHRQFQETCNHLRKLFDAVLVEKEKKKTENIQSYITDACVYIMKLKKLNRLDKHRCKNSREAVNEGKQKVDNLNLQYQNLLYEVTHLHKEVTKCLEFRSSDEEIDLVDVDQFYAEAPVEISKPEITKTDAHEMRVARLQWELEQRKRLAMKLSEAEVAKEECKRDIRKLKECLQNIQPTLQSILEAAEPLQSKLGMPLQATRLKHKVANFLPKPLYTLYLEAYAYKEACDKKMVISVDGNVDDAKVLEMKVEEILEDSGESDQEDNLNVKRHRHSVSGRPEESHEDVLSKHPLSVQIVIPCSSSKIVLEFYFLVRLNIVTVSVKSILPPKPVSCMSLLHPGSFLKCLVSDNDDGLCSPNPANKYLLDKIEFEGSPFSNEKSGCPFSWVQQLSGLHFLNKSGSDIVEQKSTNEIPASFVESVMNAIRARVSARISLCEQMSTLEHGSTVPSTLSSLYPSNILSQLKRWEVGTYEEVLKHPKCEEMTELGILKSDAMVFKGVIERGSAVLTALVVIPHDYPASVPVFLLFLVWKIATTAATNSALRELEEQVNVRCVEMIQQSHANEILICQIRHLLMCFDVFLETELSKESLEGPCEFLRQLVVTRTYRGRNHSRPYKYLPNERIFTH